MVWVCNRCFNEAEVEIKDNGREKYRCSNCEKDESIMARNRNRGNCSNCTSISCEGSECFTLCYPEKVPVRWHCRPCTRQPGNHELGDEVLVWRRRLEHNEYERYLCGQKFCDECEARLEPYPANQNPPSPPSIFADNADWQEEEERRLHKGDYWP
ncbi:MAG: hypothetical protein QF544_07480 [Candidatus Thalassarchaeaceae archaeon]|nr:hypothetical protein [Candidatus Thalassarchaeaceae archaeon]